MSFAVGDHVTLLKLKQKGVISQLLGKSRYKVAIGSVTLTCKEEELKKLEPASKQKKAAKKSRPQKQPSHHVPEFDLHRLTGAEAEERVIERIHAAIMKGEQRIHLVHGHGTGKVKNAVHKALKSLDVVKHFEISKSNAGVTVVYL